MNEIHLLKTCGSFLEVIAMAEKLVKLPPPPLGEKNPRVIHIATAEDEFHTSVLHLPENSILEEAKLKHQLLTDAVKSLRTDILSPLTGKPTVTVQDKLDALAALDESIKYFKTKCYKEKYHLE